MVVINESVGPSGEGGVRVNSVYIQLKIFSY